MYPDGQVYVVVAGTETLLLLTHFPAPFDVKLSDKPLTIVQPDIMVICDKDKLDGKRCNGAPDFIIEIVHHIVNQFRTIV